MTEASPCLRRILIGAGTDACLWLPPGVEFGCRTPRCHPWTADQIRDVAQPGSALAWGARGREFKSRRPDQSCPAAEEVLCFAQDFASGLPLRSRPLIGSTWGARGREFKSRRPDQLPDFLVPITV